MHSLPIFRVKAVDNLSFKLVFANKSDERLNSLTGVKEMQRLEIGNLSFRCPDLEAELHSGLLKQHLALNACVLLLENFLVGFVLEISIL